MFFAWLPEGDVHEGDNDANQNENNRDSLVDSEDTQEHISAFV